MGSGAHAHRVLLVDDNDDLLDPASYILQRHGFVVATGRGGEDALRQLRGGFRPCVVVLDLRMPGLDGWGVWDRMRADPALATIAVVLMSGDGDNLARARALGIRDFLLKPLNFDALIAAIERHCGQSRQT
ncbi:MAG TPA: response regulator [Candidatus Binatia bacterium]|jgi:CheY-like chemotaxis protein